MRFIHPSNAAEFSARNRLLQESMRPAAALFEIEAEYPIVLSHNFPQWSICCEDSGLIVAHANLWPRRLLDANGNLVATLGLVGNVATHQSFRGRGVMKSLLDELVRRAAAQGLDALILWSDLSSFYQKMGFVALGEELRWRINRRILSPSVPKTNRFSFCQASQADSDLTRQCFELRYKQFPTLERSSSENSLIHKIPAMFLATIHDHSGRLLAYGLMGKGYDMAGVVHEWGSQDCDSLDQLLDQLYEYVAVPEILFLTPGNLEQSYRTHLESHNISNSAHPMCLIKPINPIANSLLTELFIWGPDSI